MQALDLLGPYRLIRPAGAGAMADVWEAQDTRSGQPAALKLMRRVSDPFEAREQERRFFCEAETARLLQHPDVVSVLEAGTTAAGQAWIALEWLSGQPLGRLASGGARLPDMQVLMIGERVARALGHAHQRGVVHRDIKPDNIMVDWPAGQVKITDFGVARAEDSTATQTGVVLGTPAYMAPEQLAGAAASPAGDLYSLGVMLFELLTGRRPVEAGSLGEWLRRLSQEPATPLGSLRPDLPRNLCQLMDQVLDRAPERRPAKGEDMALALWQAQRSLDARR